MSEIESAATEWVRRHRCDLGSRIPPIAGPRALLRARLAEQAATPGRRWAIRPPAFFNPRVAPGYTFALLVSALVLAAGFRLLTNRGELGPARVDAAAVPRPQLTPGAAVPVTRQDVCRDRSLTEGPLVPAALQRQVFAEYGITNPSPDAYEIDYLITPDLGGAASIRNLWPQPYRNTVWHAGVKDQLERRLHAMVCDGEIDPEKALREIATDWISAYKKYFHTDRPISNGPAPDKEGLTAPSGLPGEPETAWLPALILAPTTRSGD